MVSPWASAPNLLLLLLPIGVADVARRRLLLQLLLRRLLSFAPWHVAEPGRLALPGRHACKL